MLIGAGGQTKAELERALGVHRSRNLAIQYSEIHGNLSSLRIANILALSNGFSPKDNFIDFIQRGFGTKTKEYDFINRKIKSVDEVTFLIYYKRSPCKTLQLFTLSSSRKLLLKYVFFFRTANVK